MGLDELSFILGLEGIREVKNFSENWCLAACFLT